MIPNTLVILGACGSSREVFWTLRDINPSVEVVFVEDVSPIAEVRMADTVYPVIKDWDFRRCRERAGDDSAFTRFVCGMGSTRAKRIMAAKALEMGLTPAPPIVSPFALVRPDVVLGAGVVVLAKSMVTNQVELGDHVLVHSMNIGHDTRIGAYTSCFSGCHIAGCVRIGEGVTLGAGTVVRERVSIADGITTGIQSAVVSDLDVPDAVYAGVPARKLR